MTPQETSDFTLDAMASYATHCLNGGQNPRAIQQAMGHLQLETTMGYFHAEAMSVKSPLELA
jgi:site-specific recombinase XerD